MDDHESILDLLELIHERTNIMNQLFVITRNAFDPDGSTEILERHIKELEKLIKSTKNIISGLNGAPVCGPANALRYDKL